jgi:hypothetical protein
MGHLGFSSWLLILVSLLAMAATWANGQDLTPMTGQTSDKLESFAFFGVGEEAIEAA